VDARRSSKKASLPFFNQKITQQIKTKSAGQVVVNRKGQVIAPGAHQAHVAFQHIDELGQFVQAGFAQEFSHKRDDPGIIFDLKGRAFWDQVWFIGLL
jgi:hypothetical protein